MRTALSALALTVALASPALAGPRDFVIEHAGVGGDAQQAAPYIQKFLEYAEEKLGWPKGSAKGEFFPEPNDEFMSYLAEKKPGFGMLDPDQYLALRKSHDLQVIASVQGKNQAAKTYSLLVKDPAYRSLADLAGKTLVSNHLQSERYLSKVVFDGKIDVKQHFQAKPVASMLKAVKAVDRGEADAALLSDEEVEALKGMAYKDLKVIWTSAELPPMPVVAFGKNASAKDREAFAKMLPGMCTDPKGAEVCKALDITRFTAPEKAAYEQAARRYDK